MNINIVCVGNLKEKYWRDAVDEYTKRLSRFCKLEIREIKESRLPDKASCADEEKVIEAEGREIIKAIKKGSYIITLEIKGEELSSETFAEKLKELPLEGVSDISFVIGGSLGLSSELSKLADYKLSFSKMTYPHQMMRVILLEQIYRGFKINGGEKYHK